MYGDGEQVDIVPVSLPGVGSSSAHSVPLSILIDDVIFSLTPMVRTIKPRLSSAAPQSSHPLIFPRHYISAGQCHGEWIVIVNNPQSQIN